MNSNNFVVFGLLLLIAHVRSIMWYMEPNQSKCLREEIQANVLVSGEYQVSEVQGQKVDYVVSFLNEVERSFNFEVRYSNLQYGY